MAAESAALSQRLGRAPTVTELASALSMDRNAVIDYLVVNGSHRAPAIDDALNAPPVVTTIDEWEASLDHLTDREALRPLLAALPEHQRAVVLMRFFGSLTQTQIAGRIGISPMRVSRLLAEALTRLRDQMQDSTAASRASREQRNNRNGSAEKGEFPGTNRMSAGSVSSRLGKCLPASEPSVL
jgi:RNA polymerase sigma-B factor